MKMFVQAEAKLAVQAGDVSAGACERGCGCIYSAVAAGVAAGVSVCRANEVPNPFCSLCIPQPSKPGALTPILVPGSFPCLLMFTGSPLFCRRKDEFRTCANRG